MKPKRPEHADKREDIGNGYEIVRKLVGYAYPRNGNAHNPSPQYHWLLYLDGTLVDQDSKRGPLVASARNDNYRD